MTDAQGGRDSKGNVGLNLRCSGQGPPQSRASPRGIALPKCQVAQTRERCTQSSRLLGLSLNTPRTQIWQALASSTCRKGRRAAAAGTMRQAPGSTPSTKKVLECLDFRFMDANIKMNFKKQGYQKMKISHPNGRGPGGAAVSWALGLPPPFSLAPRGD